MSKSEIEFANEQINRMSDLIRKSSLTHKLQCWSEKLAEEYGENDEYVRCLDRVVDEYISDAPTVDAVEVVHGHWIYGESWMLGRNRRCSVCDSMFPCNDAWVMFYCPDCGAKMDEVNE